MQSSLSLSMLVPGAFDVVSVSLNADMSFAADSCISFQWCFCEEETGELKIECDLFWCSWGILGFDSSCGFNERTSFSASSSSNQPPLRGSRFRSETSP